jgi:ATP-dependent DNA helicase RecG
LKLYDLMGDDGLHRSGAILFLDNPGIGFWSSVVKIGAFNENDRLLRHDRIDCPVIMQPDRVMDILLNKYVQGIDETVGLMMVTKYPYPERALREAVMNAIVHRDYASDDETYIRVYPDRVMIVNPCVIPFGRTVDELLSGQISRKANPAIAHAFYDMGYIERWGSGIPMMCDECAAMGIPEPEYAIEGDRIVMTFRLPEKKAIPEKVVAEVQDMSKKESIIYELICEGKVSKASEIAELSEIPKRTVERTLAKLVEKGYIQRVGGDRSGKWVPTSKQK